jgi:hypothetical protein
MGGVVVVATLVMVGAASLGASMREDDRIEVRVPERV